MTVFNLPGDLFPSVKKKPPLLMYDYTVEKGRQRGRSVLHTNALSLVVTGTKSMQFAEETLRITDDSIHFISAGNCLASVQVSKTQPFRSILVFFDDRVLTDFLLKYDRLLKNKRPIAPAAFVSIPKDPFIRHFIESLALLLKTGTLSADMQLLKMEELLLHIAETHPGALRSFRPAGRKGFDDLAIRKAVETNIGTHVTVEELAFLCNLSLSTFKRRFSAIYGTSPNKWLLQRRLQRAAELLRHYHEKPGEVYHKVGYENHSSFSQSFRQAFGMSPKEFQRKHLDAAR